MLISLTRKSNKDRRTIIIVDAMSAVRTGMLYVTDQLT